MNTKPNTMIINKPVAALTLSCRAFNQLKAADITNVGQLMSMTENDLLKIPNIGRRTLQEIKEVLAEEGVSIRQNCIKKGEHTLSPDRWDYVLVSEMDLSLPICDSLLSAGYCTVGDLRKATSAELIENTHLISDEEMKKIKQQLAAFGCKLKD